MITRSFYICDFVIVGEVGVENYLLISFPRKPLFVFFVRTVSNCNFQSWDRNRADFDLLHIWLIFYAWMFPIYEGEYCASTRQWVCLVGLQDLPRNRHVSLCWPHNGLVASVSFRYKTHNFDTLNHAVATFSKFAWG